MTAILDWIAKTYLWFYHELLQRPKSEPITRQASRIEDRWPAMTWGIALPIFGLTAGLLRGWWIILTAVIYLFAWWFLPHIVDYRVVHRDDNPVNPTGLEGPAVVEWAKRRQALW